MQVLAHLGCVVKAFWAVVAWPDVAGGCMLLGGAASEPASACHVERSLATLLLCR